MAEHLRSIEVVVEFDTNKATYKESMKPDDETIEEFAERVKQMIVRMREAIP